MLLAAGVFGLGAPELLIILAVLILIFGATRLADLGGSLGKGIREFRKNVKDGDEDDDIAETTPTATAARTTPPPVVVAPTNDVETVSAVKCPSCGALNPATAKHCNECGAAIVTRVSS